MAFNRICMLKPMEAEQSIIHLEHGKNIIGRSRETGIRDNRCSKQQLELEVDLKACKIDMQVLGMNPCGINGVMALQSTECNLEHGDIIEIVFGRHSYCVTFKPPPTPDQEQKEEGADKVDKSAELTDTDSWESAENGALLIYTSAGVRASTKIAGYDMDWTLIKTSSGNVFPKNNDDWELLYASNVPKKLQQLHANGFKICIFTNQGGIAKGKITPHDFKKKVRAVVQKLGVPVQLFAATSVGFYRKPMTGMWMHLRDHMNQNLQLQLEKCFYVGDAAGRAESGKGISKRRKDHSLVDRLFALNVGVSFYTPEVHFLGNKDEPWTPPSFDPSKIIADMPLFEPPDTIFPSQQCELVVMVGLPGSGKSHFCQQKMAPHNYEIVNADTLGSVQKCLKVCEDKLASGKSCVVDNTNVTADARQKFIEIAKRLGVVCRSFAMNITPAHIKHNIVFRELTDATHVKINEMIFNGMKKRYLPPTLDEGFAEVIKVNWKATFSDPKHEQLYRMYLLEK